MTGLEDAVICSCFEVEFLHGAVQEFLAFGVQFAVGF
jgi:hypothetical protein